MKNTVDKEFVIALAKALSLELKEMQSSRAATNLTAGSDPNSNEPLVLLSVQLHEELQDRYGPLMSGSALVKALGYGSADAFRQAVSRKTVPVAIFPIAERRGKFALTREVAQWLAKQRLSTAGY